MKGLERLRDLARGIFSMESVWGVASKDYCDKHGLDEDNDGGNLADCLLDIADQIERETARDADESEAIAWVREHGGIDECERKVEASIVRPRAPREEAGGEESVMCRWCEPYFDADLDSMAMRPLPAFPGFEERGHDLVLFESDGAWQIVTACYPPSVSGPINYCPMCGRRLAGVGE